MASGAAEKSDNKIATVETVRSVEVRLWNRRPLGEAVRLDRIIVGHRLRPTDPADVAAKMVSIGESGLISKIMIRPSHEEGGDQWFKLVVGAHRYSAMVGLGWTHLMPEHYELRELTDAQAALIEVDENLLHRELTPYERAVFIAARLKVWAEVYPDRVEGNSVSMTELAPKRGRPKNSSKMTEFLGDVPPTMGFTAETASDLGVSASTIERSLAVARGLSAPVHAKIRGSDLGKNEGLLRQIAGVADKAEQLKVVEALSDGRAKSFSDALVLASGRTPVKAPTPPADVFLKVVSKLWKAAPTAHRDALLHWLSGQPLPNGYVVTKGGAE